MFAIRSVGLYHFCLLLGVCLKCRDHAAHSQTIVSNCSGTSLIRAEEEVLSESRHTSSPEQLRSYELIACRQVESDYEEHAACRPISEGQSRSSEPDLQRRPHRSMTYRVRAARL